MNSSKSQEGFILPVSVGVGLLVIMLSLMVIERSSQNQITAIAQKQTAHSSAAAETGITQMQSLLSRYHPLATYCSSTTIDPACGNGTVTWQTVQNSDLSASGVCEPVATLIHDYANDRAEDDWKNISADPTEGQFRLVSYIYKPDAGGTVPSLPGTGELIVEGRVNPNPTGASAQTAVTQLNVQFPIKNTPLSAPIPGLWISSNADSSTNSPSAELRVNLRDTTCPSTINAAQVAQLQASQPTSYSYQSIPGDPFPLLPSEGNSPPGAPGVYHLSPINRAAVLPELGQTDTGDTFTYRIGADNHQSINLTGGPTLKIGTSQKTVVLHLEGGITLENGSKIQLVAGSKLIIYAHGPVTLSGTPAINAIEQAGHPASEKVQIYVYPTVSDPNPAVTLNGGTASGMNLVVFAPSSQVTFNENAKVKGMVWAKTWQGLSPSVLEQDNLNLADVNVTFPRISPITAWQRPLT